MDKIKGFFLDFVLFNFLVVFFSGIYLFCFFGYHAASFCFEKLLKTDFMVNLSGDN